MVIAIIGLLASIVMVSLTSSKSKARDARRISDIKTIQLALETYYNDNQAYPNNLAGLVPNYLPTLPSDPYGGAQCSNTTGVGNGCYLYTVSRGVVGLCNASNPANRYHLAAVLETGGTDGVGTYGQDADYGKQGDANVTNTIGPACSGLSTDFDGLSVGTNSSGGTMVAGGSQGAAGTAENVYDVTN